MKYKQWINAVAGKLGAEGIGWFRKKYPEQLEGIEYQSILDDLAKENKDDWAEWLLTKAGSTNTILEIDGNLTLEWKETK